MAIIEAAEGIRIGTDEDGRLPIVSFDEYVFEHNLGEMTANEVRTVDFGEAPTFRLGQNLKASLMNPSIHNADKLLIMHAWYDSDGINPATLKVMFRNLESSTVDFNNDQVTVGGWNTAL